MELEVEVTRWSLRAPPDTGPMVNEMFTILVGLIDQDYQLIHFLSFTTKIQAGCQLTMSCKSLSLPSLRLLHIRASSLLQVGTSLMT
jgi:hypothetical protein